jgi:predicted Zn-dependent peptidase
MPGRMSSDYYQADLISDILGRSKSSRLYQRLVKEIKSFNSVSAYVLGSFDPGLIVISGKVNPKYSIQEAESHVDDVLNELKDSGTRENELEKVKNQAESAIVLSEAEPLNRAVGLAISAALGNSNLINEEVEILRSVSAEKIENMISTLLQNKNSSTLHYLAENKH